MNKTKIDWADYTWNPVWGCLNYCSYCYARKTAVRFGESFEPHWKEKNFNRSMPKKPSFIFVNSMSDIAYWKDEWFVDVFHKIDHNPQHIFLFLTKEEWIYNVWYFSENCWLGVTATTQENLLDLSWLSCIDDTEGHNKYFLSIEPILGPIGRASLSYHALDWVIVGAETGNRKGRVIPKLSWLQMIVDFSYHENIPLWMKDNLRGIWPGELIQERPST